VLQLLLLLLLLRPLLCLLLQRRGVTRVTRLLVAVCVAAAAAAAVRGFVACANIATEATAGNGALGIRPSHAAAVITSTLWSAVWGGVVAGSGRMKKNTPILLLLLLAAACVVLRGVGPALHTAAAAAAVGVFGVRHHW
jgi:hypothetical protein